MTLYTSRNPANLSDVVGELDLVDVEELVAEATAAHAAQASWAAVPAPIRGNVIREVGRLIEANKDALAALITREVGKPHSEALGDVQEAIDTCDFFVGEGRRLYGQTVPSEMPSKNLFTFRRPVGTCFIITAGNFPVAVPSWYLIPALLCGNSVVWKPAEYAGCVANAFAELLFHGGIPRSVLHVVHADGPTTFTGLEAVLDRQLVQKVGFTGSTAVGSAIGELCGRYVQSPCLELGGKNPLVVMNDADVDLAVEGALFSGFGTAGQRCTSLGLAIVHDDVHEQFVSKLTKRLAGSPIGDPTKDVLYGPMLDQKFVDRFAEYLEDLIQPHHKLSGSDGTGQITKDNPRSGFVGDPDAGIFCHPTIVDGVVIDDDLAHTETFGPLIGVARFHEFSEAIALATCSGYGLSSSIYTHDPHWAFRYAEQVGAGMVSVNNSTSGAEAHLPFGGNGKSGNGSRQSGVWVLDQFTRWQSLNWDHRGRLQKAQMDVGSIDADRDFRL